jgi:PHD/YefM family antitoxin component YafN of YafNO toxin-antitoxin module
MEKIVSADQASAELFEMLDDVGRGSRFVIKRGRRRAVLMDYERLQTLEAIAELTSDPKARASMGRSDEDVRAGRSHSLKGTPTVRRILAAGRARKR